MNKIFIVPYGGLGNQLFQCVAALALGNSSKVIVLSDWGFARKNEYGQNEIESFDWTNIIDFSSHPKVIGFVRRSLNLLLRLGVEGNERVLRTLEILLSPFFSIVLKERVSVRVNRGIGFSEMHFRGSCLLIGYFQCTDYLNLVRNQVESIYPRTISDKGNSLLDSIRSKRTIVIHVRRGDYIGEKFGNLGDDYYLQAISQTNQDSYDETWIFSDDIEHVKNMMFPKQLRNPKFIDDKDLKSSEILEIMRNGNSYIIANSSFSWWAAELRYDREAKVICPVPWFREIPSPEHIIESDWHGISW